jgi:hypothetical protein
MHYIITWSTVPIKNILCIVYMLRLVNFFKNVLSIYFIKERKTHNDNKQHSRQTKLHDKLKVYRNRKQVATIIS